jgi:DNA-directed RNA polymerase specialized sigma24 family protein
MEMYRVDARKVTGGWQLCFRNAEISPVWTKGLHDSLDVARQAIADASQKPEESISVGMSFDLGPELSPVVRSAVQATVDARKAQMRATAQLRETARRLQTEGLSGRDIARVLSVSPQRVSQLLSPIPNEERESPAC